MARGVFSGYRLSGIHFLIVYNSLHLDCAVHKGGHYAIEKLLHFVYSGLEQLRFWILRSIQGT